MNHPSFYQRIDRFSLRFAHYAFLDTDAYLADQLFIKHQVWVCFREEYGKRQINQRLVREECLCQTIRV